MGVGAELHPFFTFFSWLFLVSFFCSSSLEYYHRIAVQYAFIAAHIVFEFISTAMSWTAIAPPKNAGTNKTKRYETRKAKKKSSSYGSSGRSLDLCIRIEVHKSNLSISGISCLFGDETLYHRTDIVGIQLAWMLNGGQCNESLLIVSTTQGTKDR